MGCTSHIGFIIEVILWLVVICFALLLVGLGKYMFFEGRR